MKNRSGLILYTTADGITKVDVTFEDETVWLTIISVGYRVKSQRGVQFRIWATSIDYDPTAANA